MKKRYSPWVVGLLVFLGALGVIFGGGIALVGRIGFPFAALAAVIGYVVQWCRIP